MVVVDLLGSLETLSLLVVVVCSLLERAAISPSLLQPAQYLLSESAPSLLKYTYKGQLERLLASHLSKGNRIALTIDKVVVPFAVPIGEERVSLQQS